MSRSESELFFWSFAGVGFGLWSFFFGWRSLRLRRIIQEIPTSKVRSLALGLAEVSGTIVPIKSTTSPILKKECVFYHTKVEEYRRSGKSGSWVTIKELKIFFPFYVGDETGKVLVENSDADVRVKKDLQYQAGSFSSCPEYVNTFCQEQGISRTSFLGSRPLRFSEYVLQPQDMIYVLASAKDNPFVKEFVNHQDNIIMGKSEGVPYFVISDYSEKELLQQLFWRSYVAIFGGPALFLASLAYIVWYLGMR